MFEEKKLNVRVGFRGFARELKETRFGFKLINPSLFRARIHDVILSLGLVAIKINVFEGFD